MSEEVKCPSHFSIPTFLLQKITLTHLARYQIIQLELVFIKLHLRKLIVYEALRELNLYDYDYCWVFASLVHFISLMHMKGRVQKETNFINGFEKLFFMFWDLILMTENDFFSNL